MSKFIIIPDGNMEGVEPLEEIDDPDCFQCIFKDAAGKMFSVFSDSDYVEYIDKNRIGIRHEDVQTVSTFEIVGIAKLKNMGVKKKDILQDY